MVQSISEIITDNDAQYAFRIVKKICNEVGPGVPGSPQELERAEIIKKELESHLGTVFMDESIWWKKACQLGCRLQCE